MVLFFLFTTFNFIFMYFDFHYAIRICGPLNLLKKQGKSEFRKWTRNSYYGSALLI